MSKQENDFGAFMAGFFVGGLVGIGVAMLFAPQSGEETREQIYQRSIELADIANQKVEEARAKAEKAITEARLKAEEATQELQERVQELEARGKAALERQNRGVEDLELEGRDEVSAYEEGETASEPITLEDSTVAG
jgi:gas vesicle protein